MNDLSPAAQITEPIEAAMPSMTHSVGTEAFWMAA